MPDTDLTKQLQQFLQLEQQKNDLEAKLQQALEDIRVAAGKSTFKADGKWYQVRMRNNLRYMCQLDGPPRGRPRKQSSESSTSQ